MTEAAEIVVAVRIPIARTSIEFTFNSFWLEKRLEKCICKLIIPYPGTFVFFNRPVFSTYSPPVLPYIDALAISQAVQNRMFCLLVCQAQRSDRGAI